MWKLSAVVLVGLHAVYTVLTRHSCSRYVVYQPYLLFSCEDERMGFSRYFIRCTTGDLGSWWVCAVCVAVHVAGIWLLLMPELTAWTLVWVCVSVLQSGSGDVEIATVIKDWAVVWNSLLCEDGLSWALMVSYWNRESRDMLKHWNSCWIHGGNSFIFFIENMPGF